MNKMLIWSQKMINWANQVLTSVVQHLDLEMVVMLSNTLNQQKQPQMSNSQSQNIILIKKFLIQVFQMGNNKILQWVQQMKVKNHHSKVYLEAVALKGNQVLQKKQQIRLDIIQVVNIYTGL